jgi:hypothetical protein
MAEVNFLVKKGLTVPKGSASTPAVIFDASDPNTGLYSPGADQVAVATNGQGRLFVDASGNVGIANSSPTNARLLVGDDLGAITTAARMVQVGHPSGGMLILGKDNTDYSYLTHEASTQTSNWFYRGGAGITLTSAGLVGIGTASVASTLHIVDSSSAANGTIRLGGGPAFPGYNSTIQQDGQTTGKLLFNSAATAGTGHGHQFQVDGTAAVTIDASRRVGIGSSAPGALLNLRGTFGTSLTTGLRIDGLGSTTDNVSPIAFYIQSSGWGTQHSANIACGTLSGTNGGGYLRFSTSPDGNTVPAERLRITATGLVGIGTTSPSASALLDVTSTTAGFLPPRMTTAQRDAISSPAAGLMVYNTSTNKLNFYNGTAWEAVTSA